MISLQAFAAYDYLLTHFNMFFSILFSIISLLLALYGVPILPVLSYMGMFYIYDIGMFLSIILSIPYLFFFLALFELGYVGIHSNKNK